MEKTANTIDTPDAMPALQPSLPVTPPPAASAEAAASSGWTKFLQVVVYPVSLVAGFFAMSRDVHNSTYQNLKRYGAFDDILYKGEGGGLDPRNKKNVQDRIQNRVPVEEFLGKSEITKNEFGARVSERMEHMGLGEGHSNFLRKYNYISRTGRSDAFIKGATMTGIVAAVILTIADSKPLLKLMGMGGDNKER